MTYMEESEVTAQSPSRQRAVGVALMIIVSVLWSLGGLGLKLSSMPGLAFAFYRAVAAAAVMAVFMPFSAGRRPSLGWMALSSVIYTIVVTLLMISMWIDTAASGIFLQYTSPVFCALFAWFFQRRLIGGRTILAMIIAVGGIFIVIVGGSHPLGLIGPLCGLVSGVAFGALPLVLEKIDRAAGGKANPIQMVLFNNLGAIVLLLPICIGVGQIRFAPWQVLLAGATGVFQLAIPYVIFQHGLRRVSPVDASLLILLEPVLNPLWVYIGVHEVPDLATLIGGAAILIALVLEATKPALRAQ